MSGDGVAFDVADAAFVLPLGLGTVRCTSPRGHLPVPAEGVETAVEADLAGLQVVLADEGPRVVHKHLLCSAAEVPERAFQALQPRRLALVQEHGDEGAAGVAQRRDEQMYLQRFVGHRHAHGAELDLQLPPGRRLVAHRRDALRQDLSAQMRHRTLDRAQADCDAVHSQ